MADRSPTVEHDDDALFVKNGVPVKFCFHKSVTQGQDRITRDVERHGGQIVISERLANVLLVDEQEDLAFIRRRYYSSTLLYRLSLYLEPRGFVQACIRASDYRHVAPIKQGMPGRAPGAGRRARVPFTEEDRDHLAYYLATRCPTRDGRMGNNAYKDLERLGQSEDRSWAWARHHTFHSWREHYKMHSRVMDVRIDRYAQRLKGVGHHFGHDPRRHDYKNLRQEEEEEEEDEDEDEEIQGGELERQNYERRARPAHAERRPDGAARNYLARHEQDLMAFDEEEDDDMQAAAIQEPQRQRDIGQTQAKQAHVSGNERWTSGVEADRSEGSSAHGEGTDHEGSSLEIEESDLFGDRMYDDESRFDFDEGMDMPEPFSPKASPAPEQDGPPLSTQATLIASPRSPAKEPTIARVPAPMKVVEATLKPTIPPSQQQMLVVAQERVTVRGAPTQPGPSMAKETRTQGVSTVHAPYRNTRAQSRLVGPQPPRQPKDRGGKGKGKAKEVPVSIEEDTHTEERQGEGYAEEDVGPTARESPEDEMAVEGLLGTSVENDVDEDMGSEEGERDEADGDSDGEEDDDVMEGLPRYQVIEISGPSDSDDAETHAALARGAVQEGSANEDDGSEGEEARSDQNEGDGDSDDDDTDRIERMANGLLHAAPEARDTRSMAATQQISPRRTRSGKQARAAARRTVFPSPGTKARAVVDRFREDERRVPYVPPSGTRAAKAATGKKRRGMKSV